MKITSKQPLSDSVFIYISRLNDAVFKITISTMTIDSQTAVNRRRYKPDFRVSGDVPNQRERTDPNRSSCSGEQRIHLQRKHTRRILEESIPDLTPSVVKRESMDGLWSKMDESTSGLNQRLDIRIAEKKPIEREIRGRKRRRMLRDVKRLDSPHALFILTLGFTFLFFFGRVYEITNIFL